MSEWKENKPGRKLRLVGESSDRKCSEKKSFALSEIAREKISSDEDDTISPDDQRFLSFVVIMTVSMFMACMPEKLANIYGVILFGEAFVFNPDPFVSSVTPTIRLCGFALGLVGLPWVLIGRDAGKPVDPHGH